MAHYSHVWVTPGMDMMQQENVGILTEEALYLAVIPDADPDKLRDQLDQGLSPEEVLGPSNWSVDIQRITRLEIMAVASSMEVRSETRKTKDVFFPNKQTTLEVAEELRRLLGAHSELSKRLESTLAVGVMYVLFALFVLGVTALLYWGVSAGWITRGPSPLVVVVAFFGPLGILVAGTLIALVVLVASVKYFFKKSEIWTIAPRKE